MLNKISSMLDVVADSLEKKGLIKEAYEIDKIADAVEAGDFFKILSPNEKYPLGYHGSGKEFTFSPHTAPITFPTEQDAKDFIKHNELKLKKLHPDLSGLTISK